MKKVKLFDRFTEKIVIMTLREVITEINRDRSDEWTDYDESDWHEGLSMTDYDFIEYVD